MTASTRRAALGAILVAPLASVPAVAQPSDLARACDWALAHMAWINGPTSRWERWSDEKLWDELARFDDVLDRIAVEPSADLNDLAAKARVLLCDWSACIGGGEENAGERALLPFLREVAALAGKGRPCA